MIFPAAFRRRLGLQIVGRRGEEVHYINAAHIYVWVFRFSLNIKGLPYQTIWVEFPDIERLYEELNLKPASTTEPFYTLPVIHDPSTNKTISDSVEIAHYLDATYPSTTQLFPPGSEALQVLDFRTAFGPSLGPIIRPATCAILNPVSEAYYRRKKVADAGKMSEEQREEHWKQVQQGFEALAPLLVGRKFVLGDAISFTDLMIASGVLLIKRVLGSDSREWKDIEQWNGGMWAAYVANFAQYENVL